MLHIPVMKNEVIEYLNIKKNGIYIDGTFGSGGHTLSILSKLNSKGKIFVSDIDNISLNIAKKIKDKRIHINYLCISNIFKYFKNINMLEKIDGIIIDLGLSNIQLLDENRGFSFKRNNILDMRMDITKGIQTFKILKKLTQKNIQDIFEKYGNEYKYSKKISIEFFKLIKKKEIIETKDLVDIIKNIHKKKSKIHPATKYFLAIRIYANNELYKIKKFLYNFDKLLKINGRLLIIGFNSLELKIIKNFFKKNSIINNKNYFIKKLYKIKPKREEIIYNRKSRSAILTVFEKRLLHND